MQAILIPVTGAIVSVTVVTHDDILDVLDAQLFETVRTGSIRPLGAVLLVDESGAVPMERAAPLDQADQPTGQSVLPGYLYGDALVIGEAMVPDEDGFPDYDLVGLDKIEQPDGRTWLELIR